MLVTSLADSSRVSLAVVLSPLIRRTTVQIHLLLQMCCRILKPKTRARDVDRCSAQKCENSEGIRP